MVCYSTDFLLKLTENPCFTGYGKALEYTQQHSGCKRCQYPILPLGVYKKEGAKGSPITQIAKDILLALGSGLALGYATGSPALGALSFFASLTLTPTTKKTVEVATGFAICPAALTGKIAGINNKLNGFYLVERQKAHARLIEGGYRVTRLQLNKGATTYDAYFVTAGVSSQWVIHALDGDEAPDWPMWDGTVDYQGYQLDPNHCYIAGPSVGKSTGWPTAKQIGAGYEMGLQLLEEIGATHIIMQARGLFGGATLAETVRQHTFKDHVKYLSVAIGTAGTLCEVARERFKRIGGIPAKCISYVGMDCDMEKASDKLTKRKIEQIIVQHRDEKKTFDGPVPDNASLATRLEKKGLSEHQNVLVHPGFDHSKKLWQAPQEIKQPLMEQISTFFK